ncbi:MAG: hypothetical protein ACLPY5_01550 [Candidatus Bathyarchaeia archaeon]
MTLAVLTFITAMAIVNVNSVSAQAPCVAQLDSPYMSTATLNPNSNIVVTMPVSVTCSFIRGQLYAVGDAFDNSTNTPLGSVLSTLPSVDKSSQFNGQLVFIIPAADRGHSIYFAVSVYGDPPNIGANFSNAQQVLVNTQLLATTSAQFLVLPEFPVSTAIVTISALFIALVISKRKHKESTN